MVVVTDGANSHPVFFGKGVRAGGGKPSVMQILASRLPKQGSTSRATSRGTFSLLSHLTFYGKILVIRTRVMKLDLTPGHLFI